MVELSDGQRELFLRYEELEQRQAAVTNGLYRQGFLDGVNVGLKGR